MSNVKTGVGTQYIIQGLLWGGHCTLFRIRGDTAQENVFKFYAGVGTPHITSHTTQNQGGTPHKKVCSDVHTGVGTPHRIQRKRGGDNAQN